MIKYFCDLCEQHVVGASLPGRPDFEIEIDWLPKPPAGRKAPPKQVIAVRLNRNFQALQDGEPYTVGEAEGHICEECLALALERVVIQLRQVGRAVPAPPESVMA